MKNRRGSGILKKILKIQSHKLKKTFVNIGVVGYPNTGKSSLINLLVGRKMAKTSPEAGYTKGIQKIKIAKGIHIIDTPGIIPPGERNSINREISAKQGQIGAVTWDKAKNPDVVVSRIMADFPNVLEKHYKIDARGDVEFLIENLGRKKHFLARGNIVDEERTARQILKDWQEGKIRV